MDNGELLNLVTNLLNKINPDELTTVQINQSKATNGYKGYTIDVVFSEPNAEQPKAEAEEAFYG